jgi:hypothetical protein
MRFAPQRRLCRVPNYVRFLELDAIRVRPQPALIGLISVSSTRTRQARQSFQCRPFPDCTVEEMKYYAACPFLKTAQNGLIPVLLGIVRNSA